MNLPRRLFLAMPAGFLVPPATAAAEDRLESLLAAIGGLATWAALTGTRNDSQQNRIDEPTVVRATVSIDFTRPRVRIDTRAPGLRLARALDGERHWRLARDGALGPIPRADAAGGPALVRRACLRGPLGGGCLLRPTRPTATAARPPGGRGRSAGRRWRTEVR